MCGKIVSGSTGNAGRNTNSGGQGCQGNHLPRLEIRGVYRTWRPAPPAAAPRLELASNAPCARPSLILGDAPGQTCLNRSSVPGTRACPTRITRSDNFRRRSGRKPPPYRAGGSLRKDQRSTGYELCALEPGRRPYLPPHLSAILPRSNEPELCHRRKGRPQSRLHYQQRQETPRKKQLLLITLLRPRELPQPMTLPT